MKTTLINPIAPFLISSGSTLHVPYGLAVLVCRLRREGITADISDLNIIIKKTLPRDKFLKITRLLDRFYRLQAEKGRYCGIKDDTNSILAAELLDLSNIDASCLVGISVLYATELPIALLLAEHIFTHRNTPVVLGGPHVTLNADVFFPQYPFLQYAIIGDGEIPLLKLLHALQSSTSRAAVPSLYYRDSDKTYFTGRAPAPLEDESPPDFRGLPLELYTNADNRLALPYRTSRGCVNNCVFCENPYLEGPWETKSISKVVAELESLKSAYACNNFSFKDNNINATYEHATDICSAFMENDLRITWMAQAQFKNIDEKLLVKLRKAGCYYISWGLESASARMRSLMDKPAGNIAPERILQAAHREGILNRIYFIIEHPHETPADLQENAAFIKRNAAVINMAVIFRLNIRPHTPLFEQTSRRELRVSPSLFAFDLYHSYKHEPLDRRPVQIEKDLQHLRSKIIDYNFRYIISQNVRFPANLVLRLLGRLVELPVVILYRLMYYSACRGRPHLLRLNGFISILYHTSAKRTVRPVPPYEKTLAETL